MSFTDKILTISLTDLPSRVFIVTANRTATMSSVRLEQISEFCCKRFVYLPINASSLENYFTQVSVEFPTTLIPNVRFFPTFCFMPCGKTKALSKICATFQKSPWSPRVPNPSFNRDYFCSVLDRHQSEKATLFSMSTQNLKPHSQRLSQGPPLIKQFLRELCRVWDWKALVIQKELVSQKWQ